MIRRAARALCLGLALSGTAQAAEPQDAAWDQRAADSLRIASFNTGLTRRGAGVLLHELAKGSPQARAVAEIVLRVRPDILVLQKFDRDPAHRALSAFARLLAGGVAGLKGLDYPFLYQGPVNTGIPSRHDLDGDGRSYGPGDAYGYGRFPGQYAMAVLSRLPIDFDHIRSYRLTPWSAMPGADRPVTPDGKPLWPDAVWKDLRLSSISHWDIPVTLPDGKVLHVLAAHPTPPVFDGPADRNGRRNADEIRLLRAMIHGAPWLKDDRGKASGLKPGTPFVIAADLNADPVDGEARRGAIADLLADPRLQDPHPTSPGAAAAPQVGANAAQKGPAGQDTADWRDSGPGNLRVDYVLPSAGLEVTGAGVFWPAPDDPLARLVAGGRHPASSDHRLVWVDVAP